jgi:hypothetical protein
MGDIYRQYCEAWAREGGDLFCYFASLASHRKQKAGVILRFPAGFRGAAPEGR